VGRSGISPLRILELVVVAVAGGALALVGAAYFGKLGDSTTIQQVSPLAGGGLGSAALQAPPSKGLTAEQIYKQDAPGVVQITATTVTQGQSDPYNVLPSTPQTQQALGSGFVINKVGHIITNYHVVKGAQKVQVSFSGQDEIDATVVGTDPSTDVAVLKIDARARALTPLPLGNSDAVTVGDAVFAIGNPFGFTRTLTTGVVSALQRKLEAPNSLPIEHAIQTDAAINHGNSGGPLLDVAGRVIGVTSQISTGNTGQQGSIGIGFAVPINTVRNVAAQIIKNGKVDHAFVGIETQQVTARLAKLFNLPTSTGLLLRSITPGSGAAKAGLRPGRTQVIVQGESYLLGGDILVGVDGQPVRAYEQLRDAIAQKKPGDKVKLEIYRRGSKQTVTVTLSQAPR
jgi:S1-C subfamily serine protease